MKKKMTLMSLLYCVWELELVRNDIYIGVLMIITIELKHYLVQFLVLCPK